MLDVFQETRETDLNEGAEQEVFGAAFTWDRRLNRRTDAGLRLSYQKNDFADGQSDDLIEIHTDLSYRFGESIQGTISYDRTMRFSSDSQSEFTENVIAARIRIDF